MDCYNVKNAKFKEKSGKKLRDYFHQQGIEPESPAW